MQRTREQREPARAVDERHTGIAGPPLDLAAGASAPPVAQSDDAETRVKRKRHLWEASGKTDAEVCRRALDQARQKGRPWLFGRAGDRYLYALPDGRITAI